MTPKLHPRAPRFRRRPATVGGVLVVASMATPTLGHVGQAQFGRFPFVDDTGVVIGGGTSWGLVTPDEVFGGYGRVCEEGFGPVVFFAVDQPHRGRALLSGINGLSTTVDGGCNYTLVENDLVDQLPSAFWQDPQDPEHLLIGTSTVGVDNGLWESTDGGDTVTPFLAARQGNLFDLAVSDDGQHLAVSGNDGVGNVLLLMSNDGGATFVDVSASVFEYPLIHALRYDGDVLLLGGLEQSTSGFIDRVTFNGATAQKTRQGTTPRETTQAVFFGGELYVLARNGARGELYKANDSALGFGAVQNGPSDCVFVVDDTLFGCGKQGGLPQGLFMRSADGETWEDVITFQEVHYRACPAGSAGLELCATFIETFCNDGNDDDFDGLKDCADDDCAFNPLCLGAEGEGEGEGEVPGEGEGEGEGEGDAAPAGSCCTGGGAAWLGFLPLGLLRRRRRR